MMNGTSLAKKVVTSLIISIVAIIIFAGIGIGFGMIGIPLWPFVFFMFYFTSVVNFDKSKLWSTTIGGFIGILVGMSQGIITQLTGNPMIGLAVFIVLALTVVTMFIMGEFPFINVLTMLIITLLTLFSVMVPGDWAGFTSSMVGYDMGYLEAFIRSICSYALSVGLFVIVSYVMAKKTAEAEVSEGGVAQ